MEITQFTYFQQAGGIDLNPISVELLNELAQEGLAGLKDSSFDLIQFYNFLNGIDRPDFIHIIGTEALAAAAVHAGAHGIISGLANVWPELMAKLWQALESNDGRAAGEAQRRVLEARAILKYGPTLVTCYEVLKMRGVNAGHPRRPYTPLSDELKRKVRDKFLQMGLFAEA
jgi:dihydrodipicolinate synthase/N-acetylneuraminate lyase